MPLYFVLTGYLKLKEKEINFLGGTHMCQFNDLTANFALRNNSCNINLCVGEVLLKQWKQGNT